MDARACVAAVYIDSHILIFRVNKKSCVCIHQKMMATGDEQMGWALNSIKKINVKYTLKTNVCAARNWLIDWLLSNDEFYCLHVVAHFMLLSVAFAVVVIVTVAVTLSLIKMLVLKWFSRIQNIPVYFDELTEYLKYCRELLYVSAQMVDEFQIRRTWLHVNANDKCFRWSRIGLEKISKLQSYVSGRTVNIKHINAENHEKSYRQSIWNW